jgi:hypothetical protein
VEESGLACKRLLRLTKDDYLWFMMTKRLVKRERAERWRKQARERREAQLKRRLSSITGGSVSGSTDSCKHVRTDEAQEGEQMEMEDKPDADAGSTHQHAQPDSGGHMGNVDACSQAEKGSRDYDTGDDIDADDGEGDSDHECRCAKELLGTGFTASPIGMRRRGTSAAERKRKMKVKMQTYDLRKPSARDWKWVYQCKTVPTPHFVCMTRHLIDWHAHDMR